MKKKLIIFLLVILLIPLNIYAEEVTVSSFEELKNAINNSEDDIVLSDNINFDSNISISNDVRINGNGKNINRLEGYKGSLFTVSSGASLELNNLVIDGGASGWSMDYDNRYYTGANNTGYVRVPTLTSSTDNVATSSIISNNGNLSLKNVTIQNSACSVSGCALSGNGNNSIENSTIKHIGSTKTGGALYITGGTTYVKDSLFKENVGGYNVTSSITGGALSTSNAVLIDILNTKFEDNFAQGNGGAAFLSKSNVKIKDCTFSHNMVGNDGSALDLENGTTTQYNISIENSIFEKNHGFAENGQSMGTIWLGSKMSNTSDNPLIFKDLIFRQNIARTGGAIADNSPNTYANFENIEVYENKIGSGGFIFAQLTNYTIDGLNIHNNTATNGSGIYVNGANVTVDNAIINDNISSSSGTGVYIIGGSLEISNSEISGNVSTGARGAGIFVRGYYEDYNPILVLNNTIIKNNEAATMGGGICVSDNENIFSSITIDDNSKIYDNKAVDSGDDFVYVRTNNSENNSNNTVTLDNISIAGINGIDGWYHDNEGDRFLDTDNPTVFDNYIQYTGSGIFLKAAGISSYDYNLNGGENNDIMPIVVRYGQDYTITDEEPVKDGYEFIGWNTKEDGSGINLMPGDKYDGRDGYILFAKYRPREIIDVPDTDNASYFLIVFITMIIGILIIKTVNNINKN